MRTRNALERLGVAGQPLLAEADSMIGAAEEEQILARIVATSRPVARRRRPISLVLVSALVIGAALAALVIHGRVAPSGGDHKVALTGVSIQLAGYHFRTPAGFKATADLQCGDQGPNPTVNGFTAAASAAGGCVGVAFMRSGTATGLTATPTGQSVAVGSYRGYYDAQSPNESSLYVALPKDNSSAPAPAYLVLFATGLSEDQLIAVAESGLSDIPFAPTSTTVNEDH